MKAPAVIQIQEYATDGSHDVSELLRKALLVATKLKLDDVKGWLASELNGYEDGTDVPGYRVLKCDLRAQNPFHGLVPFVIEDPSLAHSIQQVRVGESVAALNSVIAQSSKGGVVRYTFPPEAEAALMRMQDSFAPLRPLRIVGTNQLTSIINCVRTRILEWALALEEEGILGEGLTFSTEEKKIAERSSTIRIENFQGVLGDVSGGSITQSNRLTVSSGNFSSLAAYLSDQGISDKDISELEEAISHDPEPTSNRQFGDRVSLWMGKMVTKAAEGSWNVGVGAAGGLLAAAIGKFYGL